MRSKLAVVAKTTTTRMRFHRFGAANIGSASIRSVPVSTIRFTPPAPGNGAARMTARNLGSPEPELSQACQRGKDRRSKRMKGNAAQVALLAHGPKGCGIRVAGLELLIAVMNVVEDAVARIEEIGRPSPPSGQCRRRRVGCWLCSPRSDLLVYLGRVRPFDALPSGQITVSVFGEAGSMVRNRLRRARSGSLVT